MRKTATRVDPGGERKGAGRPMGRKNDRTEARELAMKDAAARISAAIPGAFEGDAHALLVAVYKDPRYDIELRVDAAKAAIRFEKPSLASISGDAKNPLRVEIVRRVIIDPNGVSK
jgi:hypothetical protein